MPEAKSLANKTAGKDWLGLREVATARGRKAVREYLASLTSEENRLADSSMAAERMGRIGAEMIPALVEVMTDGKPDERLMAAGLLWHGGSQEPRLVPPEAFERCQLVLANSLKESGNPLLACCLLLNSRPPVAAIPMLRTLVHNRDDGLSALAAAVLVQMVSDGDDLDPDIWHGLQLLESTMSGDDKALAAIAGSAFVRISFRDEGAATKIVNLLPKLPDEMQYSILQTLRQLGRKASPLFDSVAALLEDTKKQVAVREAAAVALGTMTQGSSAAAPLLTRIVQRSSANWRVTSGALRGLDAAGHVPDSILNHLLTLLQSPDQNMRVTAAMGISLLGHRAAAATGPLIRQMGQEQSVEIGGEMVKALAAIGESAIPELIAVVVEGEMARCEYAMQALARIGPDAARHLAELLRQTDNDRVRKMVLGTLVGMGRRATPAIPVMADILDEAEDDELASYAATAIWICGPSAAGAIKALLRCIAIRGCDDPVGMWAERALWSMRETAIPALKKAIEETSADHRENLQRALDGMDATFGGNHAELAQYDCDDLFAAFVDIGTVLMELEEAKKRTGSRRIAAILEAKEAAGQLRPGYVGVSGSGILKHLAALEKKLGDISLTTKGGNKSGHLSPEGRAWLEKAKEYLDQKSVLRLRYGKK